MNTYIYNTCKFFKTQNIFIVYISIYFIVYNNNMLQIYNNKNKIIEISNNKYKIIIIYNCLMMFVLKICIIFY